MSSWNTKPHRKCGTCHRVLPTAHFPYRPSQKKSFSLRCKDCHNLMAALASSSLAEKTLINKRWRGLNRAKYLAHKAVENAVRRGKLTRGACSRCGSPNAQAHHADYSKPLEVDWLCSACHMRHHAELRGAA